MKQNYTETSLSSCGVCGLLGADEKITKAAFEVVTRNSQPLTMKNQRKHPPKLEIPTSAPGVVFSTTGSSEFRE